MQRLVQDEGEPAEPLAVTHRRQEVLLRDMQAQVRAQDQSYAAYEVAYW